MERTIATVVGLILASCAHDPPRASPGPRTRTIGNPARRFVYPGFSVQAPVGALWVIAPSWAFEPGSTSVVAFGRRPERSGEPQTLVASVATFKIPAGIDSPAAFLEYARRESSAIALKSVSDRSRVLEQSISADSTLAPSCVLVMHGYRCQHPGWPRYVVDVGYSERYPEGAKPAPLPQAELEPFLRGLRFSAERPLHVTTIPVGPGPQAIAWVANRKDGTVSRLDPATNAVSATVPLGGSPLIVAVGGGSVWVTDEKQGDAVRIDPATNAVVARIHVGTRPSNVAIDASGVWVTDFKDDKLVRIDPARNAISASVAVGLRPADVAAGEGSVWIANQYDQTVARVDPATARLITTIPLGTRPSGIAACRGSVWVTNYDERDVSRIDPATNAVVGEPIPVGKAPVLIACGPDGLWVSNAFAASLSRIDL